MFFFRTRDTDGGLLLDIFDEKLHPLSVSFTHVAQISEFIYLSRFPFSFFLGQKSEVPPDYDQQDPDQRQIYRFVRTLFSAAQLTSECAIVTLVRVSSQAREVLGQ